jgi:hypothetical protein
VVGHLTGAIAIRSRYSKDIEVQLCSCLHCGGRQFTDQSEVEQFIEDIPPVRRQLTWLRT